jgi:hypothetical protein
MSCAITGDYVIDCREAVGGNDKVFIIAYNDIASVTDSSGLVTAITKESGKRFYEIEIPQATAEGKDTGEGNIENGTLFFTHEVTFPINKRDATIRNYVFALAKTRVVIVLKEMSGRYTMYGKDFGLWLNAPEGTSGVAGGDRNGYNLTFTGPQREPVLEVNSATGATLTTPA